MALQIEQLDIELNELTARIETIKQLQRNDRSSGDASDRGMSGSQMQIQGDALGQLVSLSQQASLSEYLQESFNTRLERVNTKSELQSQLKKMTGSAQTGSESLALSDGFIMASQARYATIQDDYTALLSRAQFAQELETPTLYTITTMPTSSQALLERRDALFIALAIALGAMLAIVLSLLWTQPNSRRT